MTGVKTKTMQMASSSTAIQDAQRPSSPAARFFAPSGGAPGWAMTLVGTRQPALGNRLFDALPVEALKIRNAAVERTVRFSPGALTGLAAWQGLRMAVFIPALVEADGLSSSC